MLIQRGKAEGWLHLGVEQTQEWARLSGISFSAASATRIPGRGIGLTADRDLTAPEEVVSVPDELVLSLDTIKQHAQFDTDFRELFDSLGASATVGSSFLIVRTECSEESIISVHTSVWSHQSTAWTIPLCCYGSAEGTSVHAASRHSAAHHFNVGR